ncbi:ABC transporter permease [Pseudooceanicola atlanticus]|nr:ABC transporter permease [Pseudooceanicola atlanticus]
MTSTSPDKPLRRISARPRLLSVRVIMALMLREMTATYGRSPGGYIWAILEPVLGIAFISYIFSLGFRTPRLGTNFPIFFATGMLPYQMTLQLSNNAAGAINYSRSLLAYPRVTYFDAIAARILLAVLTNMLVSTIVFFGITLAWDTRTVFEIDRAIMTVLMVVSFGVSLGLLNSVPITMFPLYRSAWSILTRPLLFLSGVIFLYESMPRIAQNILWYNPLQHITGELRGAFYLQYEAKYVSPLYVFSVSIILAVSGLVLLHRYHRDMLER